MRIHLESAYDKRKYMRCPIRGVVNWGMERRFDPWATAASMGIDVVRTPLLYARGYTDGYATIWVHNGLTYAEERVTISHELVHITQGHTGEQPPEVEELVRKITARWLVPWHRLLAAWGDQLNAEHIAEELAVTPGVIEDRVTYATPEELWMLEELRCDWLAA